MWQTVTTPPPLVPESVHVWRFTLDNGASDASDATLSDDERERAARLKIPVVRRRFVVARITMRRILALYTRTPPESLRFVYGDSGKPSLIGENDIAFNLAHSEDLALLAVAREAVGVDVEYMRPIAKLDGIAQTAFTDFERDALENAPEERKISLFFHIWTRKEATMKAEGGGFKLAKDFSVSADDAPRVLGLAGKWTLADVFPAENALGAVCRQGDFSQLILLQTELQHHQKPPKP